MSDKEEILAAMADGFAGMQKHVDARFEKVDVRLQKLEDHQFFLDRKIDNRFDLLEGMMRTDRHADQEKVRELDVRVSKLEAAVAN